MRAVITVKPYIALFVGVLPALRLHNLAGCYALSSLSLTLKLDGFFWGVKVVKDIELFRVFLYQFL